MLPIIIQQASWPGNYPLNLNTPIDTTGVTGAVIFYSGTSVPGFVPNVSVGGKTATYLGRISGENTTGTIYAWKILNPPQGEATPVRIWMDNQYGDPMRMTFVGFDTATDFGFFDAKSIPNASNGPLVLSGTTVLGGGTILALGAGHYNQIALGASTPTGASSLLNDATLNGHQIILSKLDYTGSGQEVSLRYTAGYNTINGAAIEVAGSSGPPKQSLAVPGIQNDSGVGNHLVKDPNKALIGPPSIVNTETALGAPVITRTIVAYYDLNGVGNTVTGTPGTTVERTSEASNYRNSRGSVPVVSGEKKYWEIHVDAIAVDSIPAIGIGLASVPLDQQLGGWQSDAISWDASGGARDNNTGMNGRPVYKAGDVLMVAVDMTQGWVFMGMNGQWYNGTQAGNVNFSSGDGRVNNSAKAIGNPLHPFVQTQNIGDKLTTNFGKGGAFAYAPPAGFTALDAGGPGKKTLSVPSIQNTSEFGAAEVSLVLKSIYPPSIVNANGMGGHSVIQLASVSGLVNTSVLGTHNVVQKAKPAGLLNTSFLGSHTVGHILKAAGIANASLLGSHRVNTGVSVPGIENTSLLGLPALKTSYQIDIPSILNASAFGTHQVNQGIKAGGLSNESALGDPAVLAGKVQISPAGLLNESYCGTPAVNLALHFVGINNQNELGNHFVTHIYEDAGVYVPSITNISVLGEHRLNLSIKVEGIGPTNPVFGSHMVSHVPKLTPAGIANVSTLGGHKLSINMKPLGIENESFFGTQTVKLVPLELAPSGIANVSEIGTAKIAYGIRVSGISNVSECGTHTIRLGALLAPSIINENQFGNHEIRIVVGENDKFIRDDGQWRAVETVMVKFDSQWHELDKILEKKDGVWVQIF